MRTEDKTPRLELANRLGVRSEVLYYQIFDSESARSAAIGKITAQEHWEAVRKALNLPVDGFSTTIQSFWEGDQLDMELIDTLRGLRPAFKTALLSNAWDDLRGYIENIWGIADAFDEMIISAEFGVVKPDLLIYQHTAERLDVLPHQAVFVDDFITNVEAARSLGMQAIHFQGSQQVRDELKRMLMVPW